MEATKVSFTPKDVMKLREKTGLGMMDCKAALVEADGDPVKAEEILRAKMKGKMDTRTERTTGEGRVAIAIEGKDAVIVEVRCETDFTARNDDFNRMVEDVAKLALKAPVGEVTASDAIKARVDDVRITTGENMSFARGERLKIEGDGSFGSYIHHDRKRGAIIQVEGGVADQDVLNGIATHVVGYSPTPLGISAADVPAETVERIRAEAIQGAKDAGKPEQIIPKIADGKVASYLRENTLLDQPYVKDPGQVVRELLPKGVTIRKFVRYVVGAE